jgi:hypothetical protein
MKIFFFFNYLSSPKGGPTLLIRRYYMTDRKLEGTVQKIYEREITLGRTWDIRTIHTIDRIQSTRLGGLDKKRTISKKLAGTRTSFINITALNLH